MKPNLGTVFKDGAKFSTVSYELDNPDDRGQVTATVNNIDGEPSLLHDTLSDWTNESLTLRLECGCDYLFKFHRSHNRDRIEVYGRIAPSEGKAAHQHR